MADTPLMAVDSAGVVTGWSHGAEQRFGLAAAAAVGQHVMAVLDRAAPQEAGAGRGTALRLRPLPGPEGGWGIWPDAEGGPDEDAVGPAVLKALFTQSQVRVLALDPQLHVMRVSGPPEDEAAAARLRGRPFSEACGFVDAEGVESFVREALDADTDTDGRGTERTFRVRPSDGSVGLRTLSVSAFRLQDPQGEVLGVGVAMVDATDRMRSRARKAALASVRQGVGRTLDVEATCHELVDALVPGYADIAVVEVVDGVLRGEDPDPFPLAPGIPLRRAAAGGNSTDPAHPVGDVRAVAPGTPYSLVLSDLQPRLVPLKDAPWADADPARARSIRSVGAHTLLVAPLTLRGAILGMVSLYRCNDSEPFRDEDLPVVSALASRSALSIDNARRYVHEHTIASTLQRRLLPRYPATRTGVDTAHLLMPGGGSGCWFDTIALSGARTGMVVGEVAEGGIHAATTMGQLRTVVHALAALDLEPDELLARLYDTSRRLARERAELPLSDPLHRSPLAATCVYATYDPFSRTCTVASAGHPAPLVIGPDGSASVVGLPEGPSLGSPEQTPFATSSFTLSEGSMLAFYSRAMQSHAESSSGALRRALTAPDHSLRELCDAAAYALPDTFDLQGATLLLARTQSMPADRFAAWELPHDKSAPAEARGLTTRKLAEWNLDEDTRYAAELIVSELVTNAVRYGSPPLHLRLIHDRGLTCEIRDTSPVAPHLRHARTVDEGGRGLFIISQLASHWGARYAPDGKTVWAEQTLPPDPA
ncbi:SpoIIE family protein phosphatase [Streptomyces sp. NPDC059499]|uniref:SpoIIE family protein phosphatase n=1 Tax=Streptomyces sp. NPDC059499 TaxID=3346852 RepID=UPI0036C2D26C